MGFNSVFEELNLFNKLYQNSIQYTNHTESSVYARFKVHSTTDEYSYFLAYDTMQIGT